MPLLSVEAILFDLDGTLVDSSPGISSAWKTFGKDYNFDGEAVAHSVHGVRLVDSLRKWCGIVDPQVLEAEIIRFEDEVIRGGPVPLPGVPPLLEQVFSFITSSCAMFIRAWVNSGSTDEKPGWVIVTSATSAFAFAAIKQAEIPSPPNLIAASDVSAGKPHPEPYLAGAAKCLADPQNCLVVEDAPSGIVAGKAAGCKTLAVCTSFSHEALIAYHPDFIVRDLALVSVSWNEGKLLVSIPGQAYECI